MKSKNILTIILFCTVIFGVQIIFIFTPDKDYSMTERRTLAQYPNASVETIKTGRFMKDFENWSLDQFPMRDLLRSLKAYTSLNIFMQKDNNGFYIQNGFISKLNYPLNKQKTDTFSQNLKDVYEKYIRNSGGKVYLSIIPDKNFFTACRDGYPTIDYEYVTDTLINKLNFANYIDIFGTLEPDSYYRTDQHWKQEKIIDTAETLAKAMDAEINTDFTEKLANSRFYGTYYRQSALCVPPDELRYLTDSSLDKCNVIGMDNGIPKQLAVYDMKKAFGKDPYEMFLCGSQALMTIENPDGNPDKKLIMFRDSFGSSIAPILATGYSEITLIDLRYVQSDILGNFVDFQNHDILFLYSTLIIN